MSSDAAKWFSPDRRRTEPGAVRLLCFPWAGGASALYQEWRMDRLLPPTVEVVPVELPGRMGRRFKEPPLTSLSAIVDGVTRAIKAMGWLDDGVPMCLFGHSMGARVAYEVARAITNTGHGDVLLSVLVSGAAAAHLPRHKRPISQLPIAELTVALRDMGGTPEEILGNKDILAMFLPVIRGDFSCLEGYVHAHDAAEPLACPISVFSGEGDDVSKGYIDTEPTAKSNTTRRALEGEEEEQDGDGEGTASASTASTASTAPDSSRAVLGRWAELTAERERFTVQLFEGNHFYLCAEEQKGAVAKCVGDTVVRHLAERAAGGGGGGGGGGGEAKQREAEEGKGRAIVVMLHGSGDSGEGIRDWIRATGSVFLEALEAANVEIVFPTAPERPYSLSGGYDQRVWFDRTELSPRDAEDTEGIASSRRQVTEAIAAVAAAEGMGGAGGASGASGASGTGGAVAPQLIVGGFSQGGGMALHGAYGEGAWPGLCGAFCLSGFLAHKSRVYPALAERIKGGQGKGVKRVNEGGTKLSAPAAPPSPAAAAARGVPPLFMAHGAADDMVFSAWGQATAQRLGQSGVEVEWTSVPGLGHDLARGELDALARWIVKTLGRGA